MLGSKVEEGADGDKGEGGNKPDAPVIPEAYELTAPEGMTIDAALLEAATPVLKELNLTNDAANKLMPLAGQLMEKSQTAAVDALIAAGQQQRKAWLDTAKADKEIGGARWDETVHTAARALDAFGFPEGHDFRKALEETGFGNHPDMIRLFARLGGMVGEDGQFVRGDAAAKTDVPTEARWYGNKE